MQDPAWNLALGEISTYLAGPLMWDNTLPYQDSFYGSVNEFDVRFSAWAQHSPSAYAAAGASAGYVLYEGISNAFSDCDLSATNGEVAKLLDNGVIVCDDNFNNGMVMAWHP